MSEEVMEYLRHELERIQTALGGFRSGQLQVWDISVAPRRDVSHEHVEQLERQLAATEELLEKWGVSDA